MTRSEWEAIARALGAEREKVASSFPPKGGAFTNAADWHERKLIYGAQLAAVDAVTRVMCAVLKSRSSRFDTDRFLRMAGLQIKAKR
jgi:hypothetical protein